MKGLWKKTLWAEERHEIHSKSDVCFIEAVSFFVSIHRLFFVSFHIHPQIQSFVSLVRWVSPIMRVSCQTQKGIEDFLLLNSLPESMTSVLLFYSIEETRVEMDIELIWLLKVMVKSSALHQREEAFEWIRLNKSSNVVVVFLVKKNDNILSDETT